MTGASALAATMMFAGHALAEDLLGQPTPGAIDLQPAASELKHHAIWFHDMILLPIITGITLLVLGLLIWIVVRYNKKANPVPAKFSHNTTIMVEANPRKAVRKTILWISGICRNRFPSGISSPR